MPKERINDLVPLERFIHNHVEELSYDLAKVRNLQSSMICHPIGSRSTLSEHNLIQLFALHGCLLEANLVFCISRELDTCTWQAIISAHVKLGKPEEAIMLYGKMKEDGLSSSKLTIISVLKACGSLGATKEGNLLHLESIVLGFDSDLKVGSTLVHMYGKCGLLLDARNVFDLLPHRTLISWGAIMAAYAWHNDDYHIIQLFQEMQQVDLEPDNVILLCILKTCGNMGLIDHVNNVYDQSVRAGFYNEMTFVSALVDAYSKCGKLREASRVFDNMAIKDEVSCGAMIAAYSQHGLWSLALDLLAQMQERGMKPGRVTFLSMLRACKGNENLQQGVLVHNQIKALCLELDVAVGTALVDMYARCGYLKEAQTLFDKLPERNLATWNAMIAGYAQGGDGSCALRLFEAMQQENVEPDRIMYLSLLKACGITRAIQHGKSIHKDILIKNLDSDVMVASSLIDLYAKCGCLEDAQRLLDNLKEQNVVCWGTMISGYVQQGQNNLALQAFAKVKEKKIGLDAVVFSCTLKACARLGALEQGKEIHKFILSSRQEMDLVVGNALVDMYAKCGAIYQACEVFNSLPNRNVISWNSMITGYVDHGHSYLALKLFDKMCKEGLEPNNVSYAVIFKACTNARALEKGKLIHSKIRGTSFEEDNVVVCSMIDMYAKCGELEEACNMLESLRNCGVGAWNALIGGYARSGRLVEAFDLFMEVSDRNLISWNTILAGYVQHEDGFMILELLEQMQNEGVTPDKVTFLCIMKACGSIGATSQAYLLHHEILKSNFDLDEMVGNTLIDMYANCGSLKDAQAMFRVLPTRDDASWSVLVAAYALHGDLDSAAQCFQEMQKQGFKPNCNTYTSILAACSHSICLNEGHLHFSFFDIDNGANNNLAHFNCMVDLLGRAGCLDEAKAILETMPTSPDITGWLSLLIACRTHAGVDLGKHCFHQAIQRNPIVGSGYVLMANIYDEAYLCKESQRVKGLKTKLGAEKKIGKACLEIDCNIYQFVVGCKHDVHIDHFDIKLHRLSTILKDRGFIPQLNLVL